MTALPGPRVEWAEGVLLTAADLDLQAERERRMRGLHVRVAHGTWGVALGLGVAVSPGGRAAVVEAGLAYDHRGAEIRLAAARRIGAPVPPTGPGPWWVDLVAAAGPRLRLCLAGPVAPGDWPPGLAPSVRRGEEVPLARLRLSAAGTLSEPDASGAPRARRLPRPRVWGGRLAAGAVTATGSPAAWTVRVDASAAGFLDVPAYMVTLGADAAGPGRVGPFATVRDATPAGFRLDVRLGARGALTGAELSGGAFPLPVPVAWIGVEPLPLPKGGSQP